MRAFVSGLMALIVTLNLIGCQSRTVVKKLANDRDASTDRKRKTSIIDGVTYRLPRTVLQTTIPIKKDTKGPGQFVDFAPCFFSASELNGITLGDETKFSVDPPTIGSRGEPDPEETYVVKTTGGYFEAKTLIMDYSPTGTLSKGQATSTNTSLDVTLQAVGTIIGIGAGVAKISSGVGLFALRQEITVDNRSYSFPPLSQCAHSTFSQHARRVGKQITELVTKAAFPNDLTLENAEVCLNKRFSATFDIQPKEICPTTIENSQKLEDEKYLTQFVDLKNQYNILNQRANAIADGSMDAEQKAQDEIDRSQKVIDALTELIGNSSSRTATDEPPSTETPQNPETPTRSKTYKDRLQEATRKKFETEITLARYTQSDVVRELQNDYQRAIAAYTRLDTLREKRDELTSSGNNVPADTFKSMLAETDNEIAAYKAVFLGTSSTKTWSATIEYTPAVSNTDVLFSYSKSNGVCLDDQSLLAVQKIVPASGFRSDDPKSCDQHLVVNVVPDDADKDYIAKMAAAFNKKDTSGWYYRVPASAEITVGVTADVVNDTHRTNHAISTILAVAKVPVAQFGTIASIPAKGSGKTSSSNITLDEATGALRNFQVSTSASIDQNNIKDAANAVQQIIDAKDPLNQKKRELDLIKTQNEINDEKKKLLGTPTPTP